MRGWLQLPWQQWCLWEVCQPNDDGDDCGIGDFHLGEFQARSAKKAGNLDQPTGPLSAPLPRGDWDTQD